MMLRGWLQCRSVAMSAIASRKAQHIASKEDFNNKILTSEFPVVVNFHAEWCDPCKILTPKLQALIEPLNDVDLAIVDVEKNPELVESFEVKAVPAVVAIKCGDVIDKFIGLVDEDMIARLMVKIREGSASKEKGSHASS